MRTKLITLRLTQDEWEKAKSIADAAVPPSTPSAVLYWAIQQYLRTDPDFKEIDE